ncbi:MAG: hypothetical protein GX300_02940 [Tissierellia bacterium]|nr:hypothetical protein [Tissierellia bacterium]
MSKERNDLTLKAFALIIAIVLWSYVMSEVNPDRPETVRNIPVAFNNIEALDRQGLVLMDPKEANVTVRVNGRKFDMANFDSKSIKAYVDLSGYGEGQIKVPVNVVIEDFNNIRVERIEPSEILFKFDKLISKQKAVTVHTEGNLDSNYVLGDITTKPASVLISGPRSWVNEVAEVIVKVGLDGRKVSGDVTLPVELVDDEGNEVRGVRYEPTVIDVDIPVYRKVTVPIELQTENQLPENFEITNITINPSRIALKGDNNIVYLTSILTKPIDINAFIENPTMEVELDLPDNISLVNPNEKVSVSVVIEEILSKSFELTLEDINIRNLGEGLKIDDEDLSKTITINAKGSIEQMENLTEEDLGVYIDLIFLGEGEHKVYIGTNQPTGVVVENIDPQPLDIKLISD